MHDRSHTLIDDIYEAALRPEAWQAVVQGFSEIFGGSPVLLGFVMPGDVTATPRYATDLRESFLPLYSEHLRKDLGWAHRHLGRCSGRFLDLANIFDSLELEQTSLYREWMEPQGLARIWPLAHTITNNMGEPTGVITAFRAAREGPFTEDECAEANEYVPHLRRAVDVHAKLYGARRARLALAEVMDRLPMGVFLLDGRRRVVLQNRAAERIVALDDGLSVDRGGPGAEDAREHAILQTLIADAMEARGVKGFETQGFLAISRPSRKRSFSVMVTPLRGRPDDVLPGDARVALFVSDPEVERIAGPKALADLYALTQSEVELLQLLSMGMSLEQAAGARGVSMNTARSHIKHMFAKTGVSRQGELVRMILVGVGSLRET
ncbi:MAG: helix-turn-helix transcriptional regulator [Myxococcales bacterium]|nr:helix-turn-helix transcriptional regulator [Myxococcales bacterium]MDH5566843.1 helix-turn-helix transcriptional regulator [Myxococcales bacterium]